MMLEEIKVIQKKYCSQALIYAIIITLFLFFIDLKATGKGLLLGTIFSIINFIIKGQLIPLQIGPSRSKVTVIAFISFFLRFIVLAVPLIIAVKVETIDFLGVAIGLFGVQLTMLFHYLAFNLLPSKRKS